MVDTLVIVPCVPDFPPCVQLEFVDISLHKDAAIVLAHAVEKAAASAPDREATAQLWTSFLYRLLRFRPEWKYEATSSGSFATSGVFSVHDMVKTPYGVGVVEAVRGGGAVYEVMLSWGHAVLQAQFVAPHIDPALTGAIAAAGAASSGPIIENSGSMDLPPDVFFCSSAGYVFFQLYQILIVRDLAFSSCPPFRSSSRTHFRTPSNASLLPRSCVEKQTDARSWSSIPRTNWRRSDRRLVRRNAVLMGRAKERTCRTTNPQRARNHRLVNTCVTILPRGLKLMHAPLSRAVPALRDGLVCPFGRLHGIVQIRG